MILVVDQHRSPGPHGPCSIERDTTWPSLRSRYSSSWNSRGSSAIPRPARLAVRDNEVELEIADAQHGLAHHRGAASRQRLDAREQLGEGERLDQIVVAAGAQAAHAIVDLAERADDQRRVRMPSSRNLRIT